MEDSRFWDIVESVTNRVSDIEDIFEGLVEVVSKLTPKEIIAFKQKQYEVSDLVYRWDIWAVAYILNGGCSDDGFTYFRAGLISGGREKFDAALKNPESLADWLPEDFEAEDFMYIANDAYEKVTGKEFPYDRLTSEGRDDPVGEAWDEDDLPKRYPALYSKYF
ncbi:DUF4240 domain-containing protein [Microbulbifer sp. JMSA004]|uniref:DUF4240 domain-containing protein n=1 Tax=unclassified Microbulbifer TaxID=2619833 RepID=UPI0024AE38AB|nr:DUF4240 domain-containing protein [Microbulbifer sp. VAAF005]WHI44679.1 DUF4240 domain-containing protein [Microbulbifer sp. VAAF005]